LSSTGRKLTIGTCLIGAALAACGCTLPPAEATGPPAVASDACADRMHTILGQIVLYYSAHRQLPPTAEALSAAGGGTTPPLACPVSGKPYVYNPKGVPIVLGGRQYIVVLYDGEPTHWGARWGILIEPPLGRRSLIARVGLLPEKDFPAPGS